MERIKKAALDVLLLEGTYDGPKNIKVSSAGTSFSLYIVPRARLAASANTYPELHNPGVYLLLGKGKVYVGQAGKRKNGYGVSRRVLEHFNLGRHDFCEQVVMVVDSPHKFGATELNILEHTFTNAALAAGRYRCVNKQEPSSSGAKEATRWLIEEIVDYTRLMLSTLGILVLEPKSATEQAAIASRKPQKLSPSAAGAGKADKISLEAPKPDSSRADKSGVKADSVVREFYLRFRGSPERATLLWDGQRFVLRAGSMVREYSNLAHYPRAVQMRAEHAAWIVDGKTTADIVFASPSAAGMFVSGKSCNGLDAWKDPHGRKLGALKRELEAPSLGDKDEPPPVSSTAPESASPSALLHDENAAAGIELHMTLKGIAQKPRLLWTEESYILRAGSPLRFPPSLMRYPEVVRMRAEHAAWIVDGKTTADIVFASPSAAAGFVTGGSRNGKAVWRAADGRTLGELQTAAKKLA